MQRSDVVRHELRTGGTIQAHGKQLAMADRVIEGISGLSRQHCAHGFNRARHHNRDLESKFLLSPFDTKESSFYIARVVAGLQQENVSPAFDQSPGLHVVT